MKKLLIISLSLCLIASISLQNSVFAKSDKDKESKSKDSDKWNSDLNTSSPASNNNSSKGEDKGKSGSNSSGGGASVESGKPEDRKHIKVYADSPNGKLLQNAVENENPTAVSGDSFQLFASGGPEAGEVTLSWVNVADVSNYHLFYGTSSHGYQYAAANIGKGIGPKGTQASYTVKSLNPGTTYYFALQPVKGNQLQSLSNEVVETAASSSVGYETTQQVGKYKLSAVSGPQSGQVTLNWERATDADNFSVVYGTEPGKYLYGALNIGKVTEYTISQLKPGTTYYFAVVPQRGGKAQFVGKEISAAPQQ